MQPFASYFNVVNDSFLIEPQFGSAADALMVSLSVVVIDVFGYLASHMRDCFNGVQIDIFTL